MKVTEQSYKLIDVDVPFVFIPLASADAMGIHLWIKRWYSLEEDDKALAMDCEKAIKTAFDRLGLQYNTEAFGEVNMESLRFFAGSDGISFPETVFSVVPQGIKRIKNPMRPLQEE